MSAFFSICTEEKEREQRIRSIRTRVSIRRSVLAGPACPVPQPPRGQWREGASSHAAFLLISSLPWGEPISISPRTRCSRGTPRRLLFKVERAAAARVHLWSARCPPASLPETLLIRETVSLSRQCLRERDVVKTRRGRPRVLHDPSVDFSSDRQRFSCLLPSHLPLHFEVSVVVLSF